MSISRRDVLKRGTIISAAAAAMTLIPGKLRAATTSNSMVYSEETFLRLKGSNFKLAGGDLDSPLYLTLAGVEPIASSPHSARECTGFILHFLGGPTEQVKQDVYDFSSLSDPALGVFPLLVVPANNRMYQVVVFNLGSSAVTAPGGPFPYGNRQDLLVR